MTTISTDTRSIDISINETFVETASLALMMVLKGLSVTRKSETAQGLGLVTANLLDKANKALPLVPNPSDTVIQLPVYELWLFACALKSVGAQIDNAATKRDFDAAYRRIREAFASTDYDLDASMKDLGVTSTGDES